MPLPPLGRLEGQGSGTLGGGSFEDGISHPLLITSPSFSGSSSYYQLFPDFHQGEGAPRRDSFAHRKGGCRARSPLSWLLQLSFCCLEGNWLVETSDRLPSHLNRFVVQTRFKITNQSVLRVVRRGDWRMRTFRSQCVPTAVVSSGLSQMERLTNSELFVLVSTVSQVSTRVMAHISVMLHDLGVRILRHLDDSLILASSRKEALWARDIVLHLCHQLGIVVNLAKSRLNPSRTITYLGMIIESPSEGFPLSGEDFDPSAELGKFLSCRRQNVVASRSLLGCLSWLCLLVPGVASVCGRFSWSSSASGISRKSPS